jgi:vacuolar-type H+-ATPase subunit E/Vma4
VGLQAILDAIHASGKAQVHEIEASAQTRAGEILAEGQAEARRLRDKARVAAAAPATVERARILHQAGFDALQIVGSAREELVDAALLETKRHLANVRMQPIYRAVLHQLTREALIALNGSLMETRQTRLEADPRDRGLLEGILSDLRLNLPIDYILDCQGGLTAKSGDGRVVVINTLEARLERATSHLRCYLAALFEDEQLDSEGLEDWGRRKECLVTTMATPAFGP